MKQIKLWLNAIMFKLGYAPLESPCFIVKEEAKHNVVVMETERILTPFAFHSKFELDSYMNNILRDMRQEIAEKSSDMFEVIKTVGPPSFGGYPHDQDRTSIKLRLKIIPQ